MQEIEPTIEIAADSDTSHTDAADGPMEEVYPDSQQQKASPTATKATVEQYREQDDAYEEEDRGQDEDEDEDEDEEQDPYGGHGDGVCRRELQSYR
jgi:hypothetical protein